MKVRFTLYESDEMDDYMFRKATWIRGQEGGYYYDDGYTEGWDDFEVEVNCLSDIRVNSNGQTYAAEATEAYRDGEEWIPYVTIWNPIE